MKWNSVLGSMVLALGLCAQGYSFDLLDRMLGANGHGYQTSCCTAAPACAAPACAAPAAPACGAEPTCAMEPSCGVVDSGCCQKRHHCGLNLRGMFGHHRCCKPVANCCEPVCAAAPACGIEPTCGAAPACHSRHCRGPGLLHRLFHCHKRCCDVGCGAPTCGAEPACGLEPGCGIGGGFGGKDLPPMPPLPEVSP